MHYSDNLDRLDFMGDELGDDKVDRHTRQGISKANSTDQLSPLAKVIYWTGVSRVEGLTSTTPGPFGTCCDKLRLIVCMTSLCIYILSLNPPSLLAPLGPQRTVLSILDNEVTKTHQRRGHHVRFKYSWTRNILGCVNRVIVRIDWTES